MYQHDAQVYLYLGKQYLTFGFKRDAAAALKDALALDPSLIDAYELMCFTGVIRPDDYPPLIAYANRLVEMRPNIRSHFVRAMVLQNTWKFAQASADWDFIIQQQPDNPFFYLMRAQQRLILAQDLLDYRPPSELSQYEMQALNDLTSAIQLHPTFVDAYWIRVQIYEQRHMYAYALDDLNALIEIGSATQVVDSFMFRVTTFDLENFYTRRARIHQARYDYEDAVRDFESAARIKPESNRLRYADYANLLTQLGRFQEALDIVTVRISQMSHASSNALQQRAAIKQKMGDLHGALEDLTDILWQLYDDKFRYKIYLQRAAIFDLLHDEAGAQFDRHQAQLLIDQRLADPKLWAAERKLLQNLRINDPYTWSKFLWS